MKIPPDFSGRARLLEHAAGDAGLQASLTGVAASAFGAFPIGEEGAALVVAVPRWADLRLFPMLGSVIGRPVRPVPMESDLVLGYISKVFLSAELPNFHTFPDPDFVREENLPLLVEGKTEHVPPGRMQAPEGVLLFADLHLYSKVENLDRAEGEIRTRPEGLDVPFVEEGGDVVVLAEDEGQSGLFLKMSYMYEGVENRHGFRGELTRELPVVLHPTELQLTGARPESLDLWSFDRVATACSGSAVTCLYHFLNFGNRYRRGISLRVLWAGARGRDEVVFRKEGPSWGLSDFERWFGYSPSSL